MESRSFYRSSERILILCCFISVFLVPARAQHHAAASLFKPDPSAGSSAILIFPDSLTADSVKRPVLVTKSPTTAVLLSAVLPGAGQIYTGRYWKVPIILGFGGYFAWEWVRMNDHYTQSHSLYQASVAAGANNGQGDPQLLYERDFYHDERDRFAIYLALTYLLNIIDAYVGASLYDFDVGDNLGGGASVKVSIPIH